jgi:hypothetical protein
VPETPAELYERAKDGLRMPAVEEWEAWPFEEELQPKKLLPPTDAERPWRETPAAVKAALG